MPGTGELILILIIVLVVFGAGRLPQLGEAIGRSFRTLKRAPGPETPGEPATAAASPIPGPSGDVPPPGAPDAPPPGSA
jgi:sec-independent protein translocase protein TatA